MTSNAARNQAVAALIEQAVAEAVDNPNEANSTAEHFEVVLVSVLRVAIQKKVAARNAHRDAFAVAQRQFKA